ncbi:MAG: class II aldolase/adducin family protein [Sphingomonadales bacterium]|nr:MAG: class II aldolase/adducin family protein [Sphingomonadales bacterium]
MRRDLAACYRLIALYGWDDLIATHVSVRLPDGKGFLINPFGLMFEEVTPDDLIKVDLDGNLLAPTKWSVNAAGFAIHSAIHAVRHDALCIMHLHTADGIAFHDYEGVASLDERDRLVEDLGDKSVMLLRNHGTLTMGPSVASAFTSMYFLETACTIQVRALGMNLPLHKVDPKLVDQFAGMRSIEAMEDMSQNLVWPALLRKLDRHDPSWRG